MSESLADRTRDRRRFERMVTNRLRVANLAAYMRATGIQVVWFVIIIAGAAVPLTGALVDDGWNWLSPTLGFVIVTAAGLERIFGRTTRAAVALDRLRRELSRERRLMMTRTGPYADAPDPFLVFAERSEASIATYDASMIEVNSRAADSGPSDIPSNQH